MGIVSLFRITLIKGFIQYAEGTVIIYLFAVYAVINMILIAEIISEMKKVCHKDKNNGFAEDFFLLFIKYIIFVTLVLAVISLGAHIYRTIPKQTVYISASGTHSLGSWSECVIDNNEIISYEPIKLERNSILYNEYLMGYKLSSLSEGKTQVTLNVYDGGGNIDYSDKYLVVVKEDLSIIIKDI